jgi:AraC-like DNA-binding protein
MINLRITHAKNLLKHSKQTIADIAASLGFENVSHFINMFKKQEKITPLAYLKRWKLSREI